MISGLIFSLFMFVDEFSILEKACQKGFCYRETEISVVKTCPKGLTCVKHDKKLYLVKKKNEFSVKAETGKKIVLEIVPDNAYVSYTLFVEHIAGVYPIKLKSRKIEIDKGVSNIVSLQIVGSGVKGPVVLWQKTLKKISKKQFKKDFATSLKNLRLSYSQRPLESDISLKEFAEKSMEKVKKEGLVHYSNTSGSLRHSGIRKKNIGENLFSAKDLETAWNMMVSSPSHLYNMLHPGFRKYLISFSKEKDLIRGAVIFSN